MKAEQGRRLSAMAPEYTLKVGRDCAAHFPWRTHQMTASGFIRIDGSVRLDQTAVSQHRLTGDVRVGL